MTKVSVIMTAYNAATTIERAINSVLNQSCKDIELIIVNDHSTDSTADVVKELINKSLSSNIILRCTPKNVGCGGARNYGLKFAQGEYVAFCDSDDWWDKNHLSHMLKVAKKYKADVVHCPLLFLVEGEEPNEHSTVKEETLIEGEQLMTQLNNHWITSFNCMLIKKAHIDLIEYSSLRCLDDRMSGLRLLLKGGRHVLLPMGCGVKYHYVVHKDSVFNSRSRNIPVYDAAVWMQLVQETMGGKEGVQKGIIADNGLKAVAEFLNTYNNNKESWNKLIENEFPSLIIQIARFASSYCVTLRNTVIDINKNNLDKKLL